MPVTDGIVWEAEGEGPPVVLVHGLGDTRAMWAPLKGELAGRYRVVTYDNLGHGESVKPPGPYSAAWMASVLERVAGAAGLERFALVGFSLGGIIGQWFGATRPDRLSALVILSATNDRTPEEVAAVRARAAAVAEAGPESVIEAALDRWFDRAFQRAHPDIIAGVRARVLANQKEAYAAAYHAFAYSPFDRQGDPDAIRAIRCPTLVATGEHDPGSNTRMAEGMARRIPGARLAILPGLHHHAPLEGPELVNRTIAGFLDEVLPGRKGGKG